MTAHDLISWLRWADEAETEKEKETRAERIQHHLFPDGIDENERKIRAAILEHVRKIGEPPSWEGWPAASPVPDQPLSAVPITVPSSVPLQWEGLISPSSPAYRRGSRHDGTQAEVERMRFESKGSPFDVDLPPSKPTPRR